MPQLIEMSEVECWKIRRSIVQHIQDQDFAEDDGLPGRILIQLGLELFCPDLQDPEAIRAGKKAIEGVVRQMVQDSMLQPVNKNNKVVFRLEPFFNIKDRMNPTASQPCENPQSTQEALEALEKETSPDIEDQEIDELMEEDLEQQLAQQLDESMHQMEDQAEEEVDIPAETEQQDQTNEDMVIQVDSGNEAAEDIDERVQRQQEKEQAASAEVASKFPSIDVGDSILILFCPQDMPKLTLR
jgi:MCM6 C-terminal winged-helix domain